ncbi:MAG: zinc-ribbon domain-containing protein [Candidatus Odinarchaeota archaeon]|nr:zinc-ribbon domain-containing protein [Candidatus Odinarchaeota archaeon]
MVSWSRSFMVAIKIVVFSIVWAVVGLIITLIGSASVILAILTNPTAFQGSFSNQAAFGIVFLTAIIGTIVTALGTIATVVKFTTDEAVKEVFSSNVAPRATQAVAPIPSVQPVGVSNVSTTPTQVKGNYKICPRCGTPNLQDAKFCKKCGTPLP